MAPKGRVGGRATAENLTVVFRGHFRTLKSGDFAAEVEDVIDDCPKFLFEVLKLDLYPSEKVLMTAMSTAFPELDGKVRAMSKQLKCVFNHVNQKKRNRKDGTRMHQNTCNILDWLEEARLAEMPMGHDCNSIVGNDNLAAPVSHEPAVDLDPLSQLTVDSSMDSNETCEYSDEGSKASSPLALDSRPEKAKSEALSPLALDSRPEKAKSERWDPRRRTMVRLWLADSAGDPWEELATMKLGDNGFLQAWFGDEEPIDTEHANVCFAPEPKNKSGKVCKKPAGVCKRPAAAVLKRPAAVLKRPAKAGKGLAVQQLAVGEQLVPVQQMDVDKELWPPLSFYLKHVEEDLRFQMPNQTWIKLGLFGAQSYICMQPPGEPKWPYLVGLSEKKAARNGKHHHAIVKNIWDQLKLMRELPTKAFCKALVSQLLAE